MSGNQPGNDDEQQVTKLERLRNDEENRRTYDASPRSTRPRRQDSPPADRKPKQELASPQQRSIRFSDTVVTRAVESARTKPENAPRDDDLRKAGETQNTSVKKESKTDKKPKKFDNDGFELVENRRSSMPYFTKTGKDLEKPQEHELYDQTRAPGYVLLKTTDSDYVDDDGLMYWRADKFPVFKTIAEEALRTTEAQAGAEVWFTRRARGLASATLPEVMSIVHLHNKKGSKFTAQVLSTNQDAPNEPGKRASRYVVLSKPLRADF